MNELITAVGLSKFYGSIPALSELNLSIPHGRIVGLLGPNGSGKSTFIKLINGLLTPTRGQILINGLVPGPETKAIVSYLPERTYLTSGRKVGDMLDYFQDFYQDFNRDKAQSMLSALGIDLNARMKALSKGSKEKVQLVLVMSREAQLYVLDEPIAGVDPAARAFILKTIITNYNENASILLSTHLISDIETILDDVFFIRSGQLFMQTTVEDIRATYGKSVDNYFREVFKC